MMSNVSDNGETGPLRQSIPPCDIIEVEDVDEFDEVIGRLTTPLIQVFSVHISTDFDEGKPCEIYGSIQSSKGLSPQFNLYDRDIVDPETIWKEGDLSLFGPIGGPIVPFLNATLDIHLMDRIRQLDVVKKKVELDPVTEESYDRLLKVDVKCIHGTASVYYTVFNYAIYGSLQVIIKKNDSAKDMPNVADIYGSVVVGYKNSRRYCCVDKEEERLQTRLFDKPSDTPVRVLVGTPITFPRNVIAVPAYSTLLIKLNLWDSSGKIVGDCLDFPAHFIRNKPFYIPTKHVCVSVNVEWGHAYRHLHEFQAANSIKVEDVNKKQRVLYDQNLSPSFVPRAIEEEYTYLGNTMAEVFSVLVDGIDKKISALCGTISISSRSVKYLVYDREEGRADMLSDDGLVSGLVSIEFNNRAIYVSQSFIVLNLRDPTRELEVSNGYVVWNEFFLDQSIENKQLCSVVRGRQGYAVVHHAIFKNAFEASLEVKLFRDVDSEIPIPLYGTLFARYSTHDYSTSYKKKYYRSRLVDLPQDAPVKLESGSKIAMLKSKVAVPVGSSLIIDAELVALGIDNDCDALQEMIEFKIAPKVGAISKVIPGNHHRIEVYVTFEY